MLARAADWLLDGLYDQLDCDRQELIDAVDAEYIAEAVSVLETAFPEEYHRKLDERDIAITAICLVLYRIADWNLLDDFLYQLADEIGFFPGIS
jgi:hypothetical protein